MTSKVINMLLWRLIKKRRLLYFGIHSWSYPYWTKFQWYYHRRPVEGSY